MQDVTIAQGNYAFYAKDKGKIFGDKETSITVNVDKVSLKLQETDTEENKIFTKPQFDMVKPEETKLANQAEGTYSQLSAEDKKRYRDILFDLNKEARLFVMDEKTNKLRRCAPPEVKHAFDGKQEVFLITSIGEEDNHSFSTSDSFAHSKTWTKYDRNESYSRTSTTEKSVIYSTSKMSGWDDLDFIDTSESGIPGVAELPPSGSKALVDYDWESSYAAASEHYRSGFLFVPTEHSTNGAAGSNHASKHSS